MSSKLSLYGITGLLVSQSIVRWADESVATLEWVGYTCNHNNRQARNQTEIIWLGCLASCCWVDQVRIAKPVNILVVICICRLNELIQYRVGKYSCSQSLSLIKRDRSSRSSLRFIVS